MVKILNILIYILFSPGLVLGIHVTFGEYGARILDGILADVKLSGSFYYG